MYADQLASIGQAADATIAAQADSLRTAQADLAVAQRAATDYAAEVTRLDTALGAEQVARRAAEARAVAAEARVAELLAAQAGDLKVPPAGYAVAFLDTFSGDAVDLTKWTVRNDSGQNNNLGANRPANATVGADGVLSLWLKRELTGTDPYGVAYLDTNAKPGNVAVGEWQIRCAMPRARGAWPAFWLRPVGAAGEVDVVEFVADGKGGGRYVFTVHENTNGVDATGAKTKKRGYEWTPPAGFDPFAMHTYAVRWDGVTMSWLVDGVVVTSTNTTATPWLATCLGGKPLAIRLCMQAGGSMPDYYGLPIGADSVLPDAMRVDYVRTLARV